MKDKVILLADDDEDDRYLFQQAVEEVYSDLKIEYAEDGEDLFTKLETVSPDVILLDINMPCKTGLECLNALRENPKYQDIPILIYSTSNFPEHIEEAYHKGANLYVKKPSDFISLKKTVASMLELSLDKIVAKPSLDRFVLT